MVKKTVLILSYTPLYHDPRVLRQISALKDTFNIITVGLSPIKDDSIRFYQIYSVPPFSLKRKLKRFIQFITRKFDDFYWDAGKQNIVQLFKGVDINVIIANDINTLPMALAIASTRAKVYFDAHEYYPREWDDKFWWRLLNQKYITFLCKKYIPMAHSFSAVSKSIAKEYEKLTGLMPFLITNASDYVNLIPKPLGENNIKLIHHSLAIRSRKIETMIEMMQFLDHNYTLDIILLGNDKNYIDKLQSLAKADQRIRFIPPVATREIPALLNSYDIGVILWPSTNFNYCYTLPNKIFECIQARLAIAVSPAPEIANLVKTYDLGVVAESFTAESMAKAIRGLSREKVFYYKQQSHMHAKTLSAEKNILKIREEVSRLGEL